jgi:hypothetical protein
VTNIVTDFILALLPVPLIWTLQMKLRARISLVLILGLGTFAAVAGIVRQLITPDFKKAEPWIDDSYTIWNFTEMYAGIIAASLPGMKPLFSWFYDAALSRRPGNSAYKTPNTLGYRRQTHPSDRMRRARRCRSRRRKSLSGRWSVRSVVRRVSCVITWRRKISGGSGSRAKCR